MQSAYQTILDDQFACWILQLRNDVRYLLWPKTSANTNSEINEKINNESEKKMSVWMEILQPEIENNLHSYVTYTMDAYARQKSE